MQKFQCLLFVLKRSYICYYVICMTVPLNKIHDSPQEKETYHSITPCTTSTSSRQLCCCFTNHALKKGPITPSREVSLSRHHANYFTVLRITPRKNGQSRHLANCWGRLYCENDAINKSLYI